MSVAMRHVLAAELRDRILAGDWEPGDRLPSEPELARRRQVSRSSIRGALTVLERQGYVSRRKGSGTYVTRHSASAREWGGVGEWALLGTGDARRRDWLVEPPAAAPAPAEVADVLGVPPGAAIGRMERIQIEDGRPIAAAVEWWRPDHTRAAGRSVVRLTARNADAEIARRLAVPRGTLLLDVEQVDRTTSGAAVRYSRAHHVAEAFSFTAVTAMSFESVARLLRWQ